VFVQCLEHERERDDVGKQTARARESGARVDRQRVGSDARWNGNIPQEISRNKIDEMKADGISIRCILRALTNRLIR
jgi:hypothetical protein